jgi:sec-independent protein translocase protein TatC
VPEPKYNREDHLNAAKKTSFLGDLSDHLNDLRKVFVISVLALLVCFVVAFNYSDLLINFLKQVAPDGSSFFQLKPGELFLVAMKVSIFAAFYAVIPVLLQQVYSFVQPALKKEERSMMSLVFVLAPTLFYLGLIFAFTLLLPSLLDFLLNFREGVVEKRYGLDYFISLVLSIETITGIAFQLPVLVFILGSIGIVSINQLIKIWRYVVLGAFVIAAVLTPTPDPLTMTVLAIALLILYFSTILLLKLFRRN